MVIIILEKESDSGRGDLHLLATQHQEYIITGIGRMSLNQMDYYLHHLNSTVFLSSVAIGLTILSYLLKNLIFCGNCCRSWAYCFKYNLPSHDHFGHISNFEDYKPIVKQSYSVTNSDLKEIIVDPVNIENRTPAPVQNTQNKKDTYSIIQKRKVLIFSKWQSSKLIAFVNFLEEVLKMIKCAINLQLQ